MSAPDSGGDESEGAQREVMDWAEERGLAYLEEHMANVDALKSDSTKLLTILLAAGGATLSYVIKAAEKNVAREMVVGAIVLLVYIFALGVFLVWKCLKVGKAASVNNSAVNLYQNGDFPLTALKPVEFANMDARALFLIDRNTRTARWLNAVRFAALASPVAFFLGYAAVVFGRH